MEAVNEADCGLFGDLGFDVLADRSGTKNAQVLPFVLAVSVCFYGGYEHVESLCDVVYFYYWVL